jgi:hypothetical protein
MSSLPQPTVILTHESDLDGLVSGLLLQRLGEQLFCSRPKLEAWNYNGWRNREMSESSAWVCDLTFEARLDKPHWLIVDHHVTNDRPGHAHLIHDTTKSASRLCYELCNHHGIQSTELDRIVHLSDIADLFTVDDPDFLLACDYANLVKTYGFWNLHALINGQLENLLDHPLLEVMSSKRLVEDPLGFEWSKKNVDPISGTVGYVRTVVGNNNLIVNRLLAEKATPFPTLLTLFRKTNGQVLVSLRSQDASALKIAKLLKGGGHSNAAGATLPRSIKQIPDGIDYLKRILNPTEQDPGLNNLGDLLSAFSSSRS